MPNLPKVPKGITSSLTRAERVRKTLIGLALAVGLSAGAAAALPANADASTPAINSTARDRGAMVLVQQGGAAGQGQMAWHGSHSSHYSHGSHGSHGSHYSHYSGRY